jgi:hypothetical protein
MTKGQKQTLVIMGLVSVFAAVGFATYLIIDRIKNRFKYHLIKEAKSDLEFWENYTETSPKVTSRLQKYWNTVGFNFSKSQLQSAEHHSEYPWSAAYVSDLIKRAGYENFIPSATHVGYVIDAKKNRSSKKQNSFWAFSPSENKKVEIGDILVAPRSGSKVTLETVKSGIPTHGDVVIDIVKENGVKKALVVGGNVANKVTTSFVTLDKNETLPSSTKKFAHLKYVS